VARQNRVFAVWYLCNPRYRMVIYYLQLQRNPYIRALPPSDGSGNLGLLEVMFGVLFIGLVEPCRFR
jgi:hypothetical protein